MAALRGSEKAVISEKVGNHCLFAGEEQLLSFEAEWNDPARPKSGAGLLRMIQIIRNPCSASKTADTAMALPDLRTEEDHLFFTAGTCNRSLIHWRFSFLFSINHIGNLVQGL